MKRRKNELIQECKLPATSRIDVSSKRIYTRGASPTALQPRPTLSLMYRQIAKLTARTIAGKVLGRGSFATCYLGKLRSSADPAANSGDKRVVIKRLDRLANDQQRKEVLNEILALSAAGKHPQVRDPRRSGRPPVAPPDPGLPLLQLVTFHGWFEESGSQTLCIVLGFCQGGTLQQLLRSPPGGGGAGGAAGTEEVIFPEDQVMSWFIQLLLGLDHLHNRNILHRDIKPVRACGRCPGAVSCWAGGVSYRCCTTSSICSWRRPRKNSGVLSTPLTATHIAGQHLPVPQQAARQARGPGRCRRPLQLGRVPQHGPW